MNNCRDIAKVEASAWTDANSDLQIRSRLHTITRVATAHKGLLEASNIVTHQLSLLDECESMKVIAALQITCLYNM